MLYLLMDTKLVGYMLLISGLFLIVLAGLNVYGILTGSVKAVNYFNMDPIIVSVNPELEPVEIFSSKNLNETSNLFAHIFLIGLVASIAGRISSIGVEMLRPIKVNLREDKNEKTQKDIQKVE